MNSTLRSSATAILLSVALVLNLASPIVAQEEPEPKATGEGQLSGRVAGLDNAALGGATIIAYHLSTESIFRSPATDAKGKFAIDNLPYGYFDIAVQTEDGLFVADQVINVPPSGKATLTMTLIATGTEEGAPRGFAGLDQPTSGVAQVDRKDSGPFWKSPKGIAIIAGAGGVLLLAIALGGDDEEEAPSSPTTP